MPVCVRVCGSPVCTSVCDLMYMRQLLGIGAYLMVVYLFIVLVNTIAILLLSFVTLGL